MCDNIQVMEIIVEHQRFGQGVISEDDFLNDKVVTVFFDDKKFRQVRKSCLQKVRDTYIFLNE